MQELFETVREEASRGTWTQGVELARGGAVVAERSASDEVVVRVRGGGVVNPTVVLYPDDAEWECDCGSGEDPCAHVAAAAIALHRARKEGQALPRAEAAGRVGYRLSREGDALALERIVRGPDGASPLATTLTALASGRVDGPAVLATQADLAAERALGPRLRGVLPRGTLRSLLAPLSECPDVQLDGRPITVSPEPVTWRARLLDHPEGFRLVVETDPPVDEPVAGGFALCAGVLREIGPSRLTGREIDDLTGGGAVFPADRLTELLSETLPALEARMAVEIETRRLPASRAEPPRLLLEVEREGDGLTVLPTLVYGDPPTARVDAGRLTHLRGPVPLRDEAAERRLVDRLRRGAGLQPGRRVRLGPQAALELVDRLDVLDAVVQGDAHEGFFHAPRVKPRVAIDGERLELAFASEGAGTASAEAVLGAWRRGDPLVGLEGGGFAPLPLDWLARFGERLADLLAARDAEGRVTRAALPQLARLCDELGAPRPPALASLEQLVDGFDGIPAAPLPGDLRATLRDYQRAGVDWLRFLGDAGLGALLADDMGLGKTLQTLCALEGRTLVVAPTSVLPNWADEIARFRPALRVAVYHGAGRALEPGADVTLTSYALLRRDREALAAVAWDTLVLDEAQAIKNPDSQVARAAFALRGARRVALTGTPVENRLEELWSELHFLNPGLLGGRSDFEERTAGPVSRGDAEAGARLRERIRPFVLRRRKADVAPELPPRTDLVLHVALRREERELYEAVRAATVPEVMRQLASGGGVMAALEALLRLRQACCHPGLVPGQPDPADSSKLELLLERLDTAVADGHKALVFSQWTSLLDRVEPLLRDAGIPFVRLDGTTSDRGGVVRRFQADDGPPVFLVSLRAGGTGLNLAAADHVFLLDPWWNPAVEDQAADRAHRIGQDRPVFVHRLVARDTVEERILALQERKRAVAEAALGEAAEATHIGRDELLALLG